MRRRRLLPSLAVCGSLALLVAGCASPPASEPEVHEFVDPALRDSRLIGLQLGDSPDQVVAQLAGQTGAVMMRQLSPVADQVTVPVAELATDERAKALTALWGSDPTTAGQYIARLDENNAAFQVWVTVCNGGVRGIEASYSPGTAEDALANWSQRFPADGLLFPTGLEPVKQNEQQTASGLRFTRVLEYRPQIESRALVSETARYWVPSDRNFAPVTQLVTRRLETLASCPQIRREQDRG